MSDHDDRIYRILNGEHRAAAPRALEPNFSPIVTTFHSDEEKVYEHKTADITSIMRGIHERGDHLNKSANMRLKATIPDIIAVAWATEAGVPMFTKAFMEVVTKKLDDPDFKAFKVGA